MRTTFSEALPILLTNDFEMTIFAPDAVESCIGFKTPNGNILVDISEEPIWETIQPLISEKASEIIIEMTTRDIHDTPLIQTEWYYN